MRDYEYLSSPVSPCTGSSLAEASNRKDGRLPLGSGVESREVPQTSTAEVCATIAPREAVVD
jgi:hypothetical protein